MDDNRSTLSALRGDDPDASADDPDAASAVEDDASPAAHFALEVLPAWVFGAFVAAGGLLILFHYGAYHWFLRDEWSFLADRGHGKVPDLLKPNGGAHWSTTPRLVYLVLWKLFGVTTYKPYQGAVVALHLAVAVLLRVVMRRAGVRPWLATAAAAVMVLFGPGSQNIVWAFQIGFTGSVAYGLAQLLLTDHEGGIDWRDAVGLGFGILAITSSGVGITTTLVVGLAVLLKRGWKPALLQVVPLAAMQAAWTLVAHPTTTGIFGRPTMRVLATWVRNSETDNIAGIAHWPLLAWVFLAVLVAGLASLFVPWSGVDLRALRLRLAAPVSLLVGAVAFATTTGIGRWYTGDDGAASPRYVYIGAAFTLPILAVAAQALATRWRVLTPVMVALFLLPIPFNVQSFDDSIFGKGYMDGRRYILTTAVRMPFAADVPRDVQPVPDPYSSEAVTIGFLRTAEANGQLRPSKVPLTPEVVNEFRVRLGVAQRKTDTFVSGCKTHSGHFDVDAVKGQRIGLASDVQVVTLGPGGPTSPKVPFSTGSGSLLTIELPGLHLRFTPALGQTSFTLCDKG